MHGVRFTLLALLGFPALVSFAQQAPLSADEIMTRVAANQATAEAERSHFVYVRHTRIASRSGKTLRCEEITDSRVAPAADGSSQTLLKLDGRLLHQKQYITYQELPKPHQKPEIPDDLKDDESLPKEERQRRQEARHKLEESENNPLDQDLVENLRHNLTDDKSKDGFAAGLFPLTAKAKDQYQYTLKGRERRNGRETYHLTFMPKNKDEYGWRGDAWVDTTAFQPVVVQTAMSKNLPFAVRYMMGTSLPGLGFSVTYAPQPSGTWFPVTFGGEFKINVLFFFHRTIMIASENRDFEQTHVESRILPADEGPPVTPAPSPATPQR